MQNQYYSASQNQNFITDRDNNVKYNIKDKYASQQMRREGYSNENNGEFNSKQLIDKQLSIQKDQMNSGYNSLQINTKLTPKQGNQQYNSIFNANNSIPVSPLLDNSFDRQQSNNQSFTNNNNNINTNNNLNNPSQNNSQIFQQNSVRNLPQPYQFQKSLHGEQSQKQLNGSFNHSNSLQNAQPQNYHIIAQQKSYQQKEDNRIFSSDPLLSKAEKIIEQIKDQSNILQSIVERRRKIFYDYDSCLDKIEIQKKKLNQCCKNDSKQFFIEKTSHELLLFKDKKQDLVRVKEDSMELISQYEKIKQRGMSTNRNQKNINIYEQMYQQEGFEFESMYLRISDDYSSKTNLLENSVENYKKHFKYDKTSDKFIEKQQTLSMQIKEIESGDSLFYNLNLLIDDFLVTLKALQEEVEENVEFNEILLSSYQESFNYVQQILFYRNEKIPELENRIKNEIRLGIQQYIANIKQRPQQAAQIMQNIQKSLIDLQQSFKKLKKQAKQTHSSQNSMFFVQLRAKQIGKLITTINDVNIKCLDELERLIKYIDGGQLANDEMYSISIVKNAKQLIIGLQMQQTPDQMRLILAKTQIQLSLLSEQQQKITKLSQLSEFQLINSSLLQMHQLLAQSINDITLEQSKIFPLIKYENETREYRMKKQEIQITLEKAKEIILIFKQNPLLQFKFEDNQKQFHQILQIDIKLQQYQKLLNQLLQFFQNSRQIPNSPLDPSTINQNSQEIHQLLSQIDFHKINIHLISSILEASFCFSPTNMANFNFEIDSEKNKLQSLLQQRQQDITKSVSMLQNIRTESNKPNYNIKIEQNLLRQLVNMESILLSSLNILNYWIQSGDEITLKIIHLRKNFGNYQSQVIDQRLYDIIQDNLDELETMIKNSLSPCPELQNALNKNVKAYTECLVRYALSLERKFLNPYSANYLINWLEKNNSNAFSQISYLFDMEDLIRYQQGKDHDDIGIQLKLLRSRMTESVQQQQSLALLFNQQNIIANIKLDLILQVVLKDSILYDSRIFEELISIGKEFNFQVRQCFEIRRILEEKYQNTFSLKLSKIDLEMLQRLLSKYLNAVQFNLQRQQFIEQKGNNLFSEDLMKQVQLQGDKNQNMVVSILNVDRDLFEGITHLNNYLFSYIKLQPFLNLNLQNEQNESSLFNDIFTPHNNYNLFSLLQEFKQSVDILLDGQLLEIIRSRHYREKEIVDRIKLDKKMGIFEFIYDCQIMKDLRSNIDLIKWKEIFQKTINSITKDFTNSFQAQQIQEEFSRINQLNRNQQIFVNKFINFQQNFR